MTVFKKVMVADRLPVEWRGVFGFECYYEVSNTGLIRSLDRVIIDKRGSKQFFKGKVLKPAKNNSGYLNVCLKIRGNNINKSVLVHRIVAQSFISNEENKETVNHKDFNVLNNNVDNLEWCTHIENMRHMYNGKPPRREKRSKNLNSKKISQFDLNGNHIRDYDCIKDVDVFNFIPSCVTRVCKGQRPKHKGYFFKYITLTTF